MSRKRKLTERLSPRERQVLYGSAAGETARETAERLGLSFETVRTHRKKVLAKLDLRSMDRAVALALSHGEIRPRDVAAIIEEGN